MHTCLSVFVAHLCSFLIYFGQSCPLTRVRVYRLAVAAHVCLGQSSHGVWLCGMSYRESSRNLTHAQCRKLEMGSLLRLPLDLNTLELCEQFVRVLGQTFEEAAVCYMCIASSSTLIWSFSDQASAPRGLQSVSHVLGSHLAHVSSQSAASEYGWTYYPLGILKLLADGAGFVGPIVLHEFV